MTELEKALQSPKEMDAYLELNLAADIIKEIKQYSGYVTKNTERRTFAAMANVDVDGYSCTYAEQILGESYPGLDDFKAHLNFWAKFKTYIKVLEADLLIEALNKQP